MGRFVRYTCNKKMNRQGGKIAKVSPNMTLAARTESGVLSVRWLPKQKIKE